MTREIDMLNGSLWKNLLLYSIPLMFSNVLQVLFNMSDVIVVGRFAGPIALGSVGSTTTLVQLTTGIMFGIGTGINAIVAFHTGANEKILVRRAVHTAFIISLVTGLILSIIGLTSSRFFLRILGTKDELISGAKLYLSVYLLGSPALALYNYGNAILTAIGDTKRPLIYLSISGIINILLNLFFVIVLNLSVLGVALASIISQYISCILIVVHLTHLDKEFALSFKDIKWDPVLSKEILKIGIPISLQHALFSLSNLFVQASINYFDHTVVEGCAAAGNADNLVYDMMAAFYTASTSFISQNYGAKRIKRIRSVYLITTLYSFIVGLILGGLIWLFREPFLYLFTTDPSVIQYGSERLVVMGVSFCISAFMDNAAAASRGLGKSIGPTIIVVMGTIVFRIIWIYTVFRSMHTLFSLFAIYPASWIFTSIAANIYFIINYKKLEKSVIEEGRQNLKN